MANTGIAIFDIQSNLIKILSIKTNPKESHGSRLNEISEKIINLKKEYIPFKIIIENAFSKHNKATQVLYRVHGIVNYIFYNYPQIYYAPTTIKKAVTGRGNAKKEEVYKIIQELYPNFEFKNLDESDAVGIGLTYFIKKGELTC